MLPLARFHVISSRWCLSLGMALLFCAAGCGTDIGQGNLAINENPEPTNPPATTLRCIPQDSTGLLGISFTHDIVPIFAQGGCLTSGCHGGDNVASGYSLDTYEGIFGPGDQASILNVCNVVAGDPDACYLLHKLDLSIPLIGVRMPNTGLWMSDADFDLLQTWIIEGALDN